jgi:ABC-type Na+ efflux pump permease subunit
MSTRTDRIHARLTPVEPAAERMPYWTRSTNPIVRRHLGLYWRTLPPEVRPVLQALAVWSGLLLAGALIPATPFLIGSVIIVSLFVLPVALFTYAHVLVHIAINASAMMQEERRNDTLNLLMATPMTLEQILLGKVAAAVWRRMDDWILITYAVALTLPPVLYGFYMSPWESPGFVFALPLAVIAGLAATLLRLVVEPLMVGTLAVFIGAVVPYRSTAIIVSVALGAAYFFIYFMVARLPFIYGAVLRDGTVIPGSPALMRLFDFVLPAALPALITWTMLKLAVRVLTRD